MRGNVRNESVSSNCASCGHPEDAHDFETRECLQCGKCKGFDPGFTESSLKEGSIGKLDGDSSDILDGIVGKFKNKSAKDIVPIVKKELGKDALKHVSDSELLKYIEDSIRIFRESLKEDAQAVPCPQHLRKKK